MSIRRVVFFISIIFCLSCSIINNRSNQEKVIINKDLIMLQKKWYIISGEYFDSKDSSNNKVYDISKEEVLLLTFNPNSSSSEVSYGSLSLFGNTDFNSDNYCKADKFATFSISTKEKKIHFSYNSNSMHKLANKNYWFIFENVFLWDCDYIYDPNGTLTLINNGCTLVLKE